MNVGIKLSGIKMIKRINEILTWGVYCDSCATLIGTCLVFEYEKDQELQYSPILCEKCGREHNKFVGDTVQENEQLKKAINQIAEKTREKILGY